MNTGRRNTRIWQCSHFPVILHGNLRHSGALGEQFQITLFPEGKGRQQTAHLRLEGWEGLRAWCLKALSLSFQQLQGVAGATDGCLTGFGNLTLTRTKHESENDLTDVPASDRPFTQWREACDASGLGLVKALPTSLWYWLMPSRCRLPSSLGTKE